MPQNPFPILRGRGQVVPPRPPGRPIGWRIGAQKSLIISNADLPGTADETVKEIKLGQELSVHNSQHCSRRLDQIEPHLLKPRWGCAPTHRSLTWSARFHDDQATLPSKRPR